MSGHRMSISEAIDIFNNGFLLSMYRAEWVDPPDAVMIYNRANNAVVRVVDRDEFVLEVLQCQKSKKT
jgi:hypothetical protein